MRKACAALVLLLGLSMGACCPIDKKAVSDVEASYELAKKDHLQRIEKDANTPKEKKEDWTKFYDSYGRLIQALKKAVE